MKIENRLIQVTIKFLDDLSLKGRSSIGRTKLKDSLTKQVDILSKDQKVIIDEYNGWVDEDKGKYSTSNKEQNEAMESLLLEEVSVEFNSPFRIDFITALENYDGELSGSDGDIYALLYERLIEEEK